VNIASADEAALSKALQMVGDITAVPEVGKTYLGKVVRLAEFGAFVEIFPGTDGLLHISEIAEHRVKDVRDELKEGDQVLVKVLALEGNRIKLSRKAVLREQRAKMGGGPPVPPQVEVGEPNGDQSEAITIEGGGDFTEEGSEEESEPNFNRAQPVAHGDGGDRGPRRPGGGGGGGGRNRRRRGGRGGHGGHGGGGRGGPRN
jgi:polyribonucleotide nucleotidyltransferase